MKTLLRLLCLSGLVLPLGMPLTIDTDVSAHWGGVSTMTVTDACDDVPSPLAAV